MVDKWDDLKVLLAVSRAGSFTAAGKTLHMDQTTVTRRLRRFEASVGLPLFERGGQGVVLTDAGRVWRTCAEGWEAQLHDAVRRVEGGLSTLSGTVRVALPELLAIPWMTEIVAFSAKNPELTLDVVGGDELHSLERREADVAVRVLRSDPPEHLVAKPFGRLFTAIYAHEQFGDAPLDQIPWVGWDLAEAPEGRIEVNRRELAPGASYAVLVNSYGLLLDAIRAGGGASFLPCVAGDSLSGVIRKTSPVDTAGVWLLTHPDLRRSRRVRVVTDFLGGLLERSFL